MSSEYRGECFIIMPFKTEMFYFFLFLQQHIQDKHKLECKRADDIAPVGSFAEKIKTAILRSDVIIVDYTGGNPNVFYELGIAHAQDKSVVPIMMKTADFSPEDIPSDVRHLEVIFYDENYKSFLEKLDSALEHILYKRYEALYDRAHTIFNRFRQATGSSATVVGKEDFIASLKQIEAIRRLPSPQGDEKTIAEFLLLTIIANSREPAIVSQVIDWITSSFQM